MKPRKVTPIPVKSETMWKLTDDRQTVRLQLPPLSIASIPEPFTIRVDFDAVTVDAIIRRLTILREQMITPPPVPRERH